jgi:hypothetical protein
MLILLKNFEWPTTPGGELLAAPGALQATPLHNLANQAFFSGISVKMRPLEIPTPQS